MALNVSSTVDKISIITSPVLLRGIFEIKVPDLKLDWLAINHMLPQERAAILDMRLRDNNATSVAEHDAICSVLSAIFNVSSFSGNAEFMKKQITAIGLQDNFALYDFGLSSNAITTANIAAWVYVRSQQNDSNIPDEKRHKLEALWRRLLVISDNVEKTHSTITLDVTEQTKNTEEMEAGIKTFMDHYTKKLKGLSGLRDFPMTFSIATHSAYVRYTFTTPQYPHDTTQTDGSHFYIDRDPNATGFVIDHYPVRQYLKLTRVTDNTITKKIAESFAKHVLGASVVYNNQKHYPLSMFRNASYKLKLTLPPERESLMDRVWVSAIDCVYARDGAQSTETYCAHDYEGDDILTNIEEHFPVSKYPVELREIKEVEISFCLSRLDDRAKFHHKGTIPHNTYRIQFKPTGKNPFAAFRKMHDEHKAVILDVLERCGLTGKTLEELGDDE